MSLLTFDDIITLLHCLQLHNILFSENGRAAVSQCERLMSLHSLTIYITEYLTTVLEFVGKVIMFLKASVGLSCTRVIWMCEAWNLWRNLKIGDSLRNQVILCALNSDVYGYTLPPPRYTTSWTRGEY